MHELALTQEMVDACSERAAGRSVRRVIVEIGALSGVLADSVRFCFPLCAEGTALEGAALEIQETCGEARCRRCERRFTVHHLYGACACGSGDLEILHGQELRLRSMEVS
jgi:hydrogenase nickel incorporation protein HypA/HybF